MVPRLIRFVLCTIVATSLSTTIADERQPLSMTAVAPKTSPTLKQVNEGTFTLTVQLKNTGSDTIVLWPYLSLKILEPDGDEVGKATSIGRWGFISSPSVLEDIPFATLDAGKTYDFKVNLKKYNYDPNVVGGWQLPKAGKYELLFSYKFDRAAVKKRYGKGCKDIDGANRPWNRAVEIEKTLKLELAVQ
jgi:hypothetical protein